MITDGNGGQGSNTPAPIESNVNLGALLGNSFGVGNQNPAPATPNPTAPTNVDPATPPANGQVVPTTPNGQVAPTVIPDAPQTPAPVVETVIPDNPQSFEEVLLVVSPSSTSPLKAEIFKLFKANGVDDKGNLVNAQGNLVLSAEDFRDFVDNDNLPVNENGEAINALGEVIKSKEQLLQDNSVIVPVREAVETNFGIKLPEGTEFPDTTEGIVKLVQESVKQLNVGVIKNYLETNPEIKGFAQHLALGGTAENYSPSNINYKEINVKTLDEVSKLEFLKRSFGLQGNPNPDSIIKLIQKEGEEELNKQVGAALTFLDAKQTQTNQLRDQQIQHQIKAQEEADNRYWNDVQKTVLNGKLGSLDIPVKERQAFFDYMAKPINDKYESAEAQDIAKDSMEFELMVSYLRYKKGDVSQLVENLAKTKQVKSLSDRVNKFNGINNASGVPISNNTNKVKSNLTIETLLG